EARTTPAARPTAEARGSAGARPARPASPRCRPALRSPGSLQILPQRLGEPLQRRARACLDGSERQIELLGDLALGELAPVGELDEPALVVGQRLERPVHEE